MCPQKRLVGYPLERTIALIQYQKMLVHITKRAIRLAAVSFSYTIPPVKLPYFTRIKTTAIK
jgi:hypothetical protein